MTVKVTLDTNILISGYLFQGPPSKVLELCINRNIYSITSPFIINEFESVLKRKFQKSDFYIKTTINNFISFSQIVYPKNSIRLLKYVNDPEDAEILGTAVKAKSHYLVTGNIKHFNKREINGVKIIRASDFLNLEFK